MSELLREMNKLASYLDALAGGYPADSGQRFAFDRAAALIRDRLGDEPEPDITEPATGGRYLDSWHARLEQETAPGDSGG